MSSGAGAVAEALAGYDDFTDDGDAFRADVLAGLALPQKRIPSKYFYDARGSRLFDRICDLDEYYPTRTEMAILRERAGEIAGLIGPRGFLIELGSGSSTKVRIILDALEQPAAYIPVDISRDHLLESARALAADYPGLPVRPVCADYTAAFELPEASDEHSRIGFFPGSTIGNFPPAEAGAFLARTAGTLGHGSALVIGVDLKKDRARLEPAYNDSEGVTAAFNLNLLARINRELDGSFDLSGFRHEARYEAAKGRVEMHLVSRRAQMVRVAGRAFAFRAGESIHTEDSCKYSVDEFVALASANGWHAERSWTDPEELFSVHFLRAR